MAEQTPMTPSAATYRDDEISISDLVMKLWAKRGLIIFLPLVLAGLTLVALLIGKTGQQATVSYYIELNGISLSSKKTIEGSVRDISTRYPNGTVFSPQDLVNPSVMKILAESTGLDTTTLSQNINVQFGTPISNGVLKEYKAALAANRKASAEDLAALNTHYADKINAAAKRGLKITIDYVEMGVTKEKGAQLAELLPKLWNKVYTEQFLTLLPSRILGLSWTDDTHDLSTPIGLQEASIQIGAIEQGIDEIAADGRLVGLLNVHNVSVTDIKTYLDKFREIYFEPLFLAAFQKDGSLTQVYERDIAVQTRVIDSEVAELDRRLDILINVGGSRNLESSGRGQDSAPGLDGGAFSQVISLAEQASLSKFIETTLKRRYQLVEKKALLQARVDRMSTGIRAEANVSDGFRSQATERYQTIVAGYDDMLTKAKEIASATTPAFYSVITQPATEGSLIAKRDLLFLALAISLGGMLAVIAALVWPQRHQ